MRTIHPSPLLRGALIADAVVSGAAALLQLGAAGWLSALLALPRELLVETGAFLVVYAAMLVVIARSPGVWSVLIAIIVAGNVAWAVACVGLLLASTLAPSGLGVAFILLQTVAVLVFAALEYAGLRGSAPSARAGAAVVG